MKLVRKIEELLDAYFIVRISWVFGVNGKNFFVGEVLAKQFYDHGGKRSFAHSAFAGNCNNFWVLAHNVPFVNIAR